MQGAEEASEARACRDCGEALLGRYCHACGEDSLPPARAIGDLFEDLLDNVFSFTGAVPRTAVALFTRPSLVARAQRSGDRKSFLSPVKLYVTASLVFFLFLGLTGVTFIQLAWIRTGDGPAAVDVTRETPGPVNFRMEERFLHPPRAAPRDAEVIAAFDAALEDLSDPSTRSFYLLGREMADDPSRVNDQIATWAPRLLWLMMPFHAALLWLLFRKGRLLAEHLILSLWAHSLLFLLLIGGALWNMTGLLYGLQVALVGYQVYFTAALRGYYETSWFKAGLKAALHSAAYLTVWLLIVITYFFAQTMVHLPASYWES